MIQKLTSPHLRLFRLALHHALAAHNTAAFPCNVERSSSYEKGGQELGIKEVVNIQGKKYGGWAQ